MGCRQGTDSPVESARGWVKIWMGFRYKWGSAEACTEGQQSLHNSLTKQDPNSEHVIALEKKCTSSWKDKSCKPAQQKENPRRARSIHHSVSLAPCKSQAPVTCTSASLLVSSSTSTAGASGPLRRQLSTACEGLEGMGVSFQRLNILGSNSQHMI